MPNVLRPLLKLVDGILKRQILECMVSKVRRLLIWIVLLLTYIISAPFAWVFLGSKGGVLGGIVYAFYYPVKLLMNEFVFIEGFYKALMD